MKFADMLHTTGVTSVPPSSVKKTNGHSNLSEKETQKPEDVLRNNGFKIRLVTSTSFGTQVDLAKKYNLDDVSKALEGFNIKIKGQSIFIVE